MDAERILTAAAVPSRMIEAWALADREALAEALGADVVELAYRRPEELWGDDEDPYSNHPKCVWRRVTGGQLSHADIAARARPAVLERECRESFAPFAREVAAALDRCPAG